jgi:hypothetical protein
MWAILVKSMTAATAEQALSTFGTALFLLVSLIGGFTYLAMRRPDTACIAKESLEHVPALTNAVREQTAQLAGLYSRMTEDRAMVQRQQALDAELTQKQLLALERINTKIDGLRPGL